MSASANQARPPETAKTLDSRARASSAALEAEPGETVGSTMLDREEALRPHGQHDGHQEVDEHRRDGGARRLRERALHEFAEERRQERAADRIDDADDQRAIERAADRADAAGHDDDEREDQDGL